MTDAKQARLTSYYTELKKFIDNANHVKAIKCCNKIITEFDNEVKALQCKAVAYIQLGQFKEALEFLKKSKNQEDLVFERAYCEYRLNDVEAAWKTISSQEDSTSQRIKELKAQILYRLERFDECFTTYREIIRSTSDDFDLERQTNISAVSVNKSFENMGNDDVIEDDSTYELVYNGATHYLAKGQIEKALTRLKAAEEQCKEYLSQEEGASEDEVNEEVAIIRVQQGYCLQILGREKEALAIYNSVLKTKPEDPALLACINNNLVSINRGSNVFDSRKRMKTATTHGLEHKLTSKQRGTIALNQCILAYQTHQSDVCLQEIAKLEEQFPQLRTSAALVKAAQLGRLGQMDDVVAALSNLSLDDASESTFMKLATVQILLSQGAKENACGVLNSLDENIKYKAGIVSTLVALYTSLNNKSAASDILCKSVDWNKKNKTSSGELSNLWRHAADFHLRGGNASTAASSLMELHKLNPKDVKTLAQLITAYSQFDTAKAQQLSKQLPPVSQLANDINIDALEASVGPKYFRKFAAGKGGDASPVSPKSPVSASAEVKKNKKKKKRKIRLPKDCVEGVMPDPERWLPKWQRKTYKKKRDRRNKDVMRGTQGVSSEAADKFDITKTATGGPPKNTKPLPQPSQSKTTPRNAQKKGNKQKKKKSGW